MEKFSFLKANSRPPKKNNYWRTLLKTHNSKCHSSSPWHSWTCNITKYSKFSESKKRNLKSFWTVNKMANWRGSKNSKRPYRQQLSRKIYSRETVRYQLTNLCPLLVKILTVQLLLLLKWPSERMLAQNPMDNKEYHSISLDNSWTLIRTWDYHNRAPFSSSQVIKWRKK